MSPPFKGDDNQGGKQQKDEEPSWSVEEEGGACPNPALHHQEQHESLCKAILFMQAGLGTFVPQLFFTLFFMYGTVLEIERQIQRIKMLEERKTPPGIAVVFLNEVPLDADHMTFRVPFCGEGYLKLEVEVDDQKCFYCFDPNKVLVSIADILLMKPGWCLDGTPAHKMRLRGPELPAYIPFSLRCREKSQMRTPTNFKLVITTTDKDGKKIFGNHTVEKLYSACFYNTDADLEKKPNAGNVLMEENQEKICELLQDWNPVIQWLVTNGRLDKRFLTFLDESPLSEERKGEILRHLYQVENVFPMFIEALQTSDDNKELVVFLNQCMSLMENQNSSL